MQTSLSLKHEPKSLSLKPSNLGPLAWPLPATTQRTQVTGVRSVQDASPGTAGDGLLPGKVPRVCGQSAQAEELSEWGSSTSGGGWRVVSRAGVDQQLAVEPGVSQIQKGQPDPEPTWSLMLEVPPLLIFSRRGCSPMVPISTSAS